jgi:hypothetical protein
MYLPSRMQGSGALLRTLALWRVCSKTQDVETFNRCANSCGVKMSLGSITASNFAAGFI